MTGEPGRSKTQREREGEIRDHLSSLRTGSGSMRQFGGVTDGRFSMIV